MKKKISIIILAVTLSIFSVFALTGCGGRDRDSVQPRVYVINQNRLPDLAVQLVRATRSGIEFYAPEQAEDIEMLIGILSMMPTLPPELMQELGFLQDMLDELGELIDEFGINAIDMLWDRVEQYARENFDTLFPGIEHTHVVINDGAIYVNMPMMYLAFTDMDDIPDLPYYMELEQMADVYKAFSSFRTSFVREGNRYVANNPLIDTTDIEGYNVWFTFSDNTINLVMRDDQLDAQISIPLVRNSNVTIATRQNVTGVTLVDRWGWNLEWTPLRDFGFYYVYGSVNGSEYRLMGVGGSYTDGFESVGEAYLSDFNFWEAGQYSLRIRPNGSFFISANNVLERVYVTTLSASNAYLNVEFSQLDNVRISGVSGNNLTWYNVSGTTSYRVLGKGVGSDEFVTLRWASGSGLRTTTWLNDLDNVEYIKIVSAGGHRSVDRTLVISEDSTGTVVRVNHQNVVVDYNFEVFSDRLWWTSWNAYQVSINRPGMAAGAFVPVNNFVWGDTGIGFNTLNLQIGVNTVSSKHFGRDSLL
ncbi:MAG: hypothetical protein FWC80_05465 [Firmicutes bacterium]|nr:hypothetical protein [Bacillota bacterium]